MAPPPWPRDGNAIDEPWECGSHYRANHSLSDYAPLIRPSEKEQDVKKPHGAKRRSHRGAALAEGRIPIMSSNTQSLTEPNRCVNPVLPFSAIIAVRRPLLNSMLRAVKSEISKTGAIMYGAPAGS
jgi:hypothetical protein